MAHAFGCPVSWLSPKRKVTKRQRPTYDRCHAAFQAGVLWSWAIDTNTGLWLVKLTATDEWRELPQHGVDDLLDMHHPQTHTQKEGHMATTTKSRKSTKAAAEVVIPEAVTEYVARLVHEPKRLYAIGVAQALVKGEPIPTFDAPWADKVVAKLTKLTAVAA